MVWRLFPDGLEVGTARVDVIIRSTSLYRWLPYSEGSQERRRGSLGRWQRASEFGFRNMIPPPGSDWRHEHVVAPTKLDSFAFRQSETGWGWEQTAFSYLPRFTSGFVSEQAARDNASLLLHAIG